MDQLAPFLLIGCKFREIDVLGKEAHHKPHMPSARREIKEKHCDL